MTARNLGYAGNVLDDVGVGVIGLGAMGGAMARRLLDEGLSVYVFDVNDAMVRGLKQAGACSRGSPAAVLEAADVTILSLPNSSIVEKVVLGPDGLLERPVTGKIVVDMSSSDPDSTLVLGKRFADAGIDFLDAPVSRGAQAARDGTLSILVGGNQVVLERVRDVLEQLGTDILHVGPLAAGHAAKALNNHLSATALLAAFEGFIVASTAGVEPSVAVQAINQGSGRSHMSQVRFPRYFLPRMHNSHFALDLMHKDCQIAIEMSQRVGKPMMLGSLTSQLYRIAVNRGMGPSDNTYMMEAMESLLGSRME